MFKKITDLIKKLIGGNRQRRNRPPRRRVNSNGSDIQTVYPSHESFGSLITAPEKRARRDGPKHKRKSSTFTTESEKEMNKGKVKRDSSSIASNKSNKKLSFSM